MPSKSSVSYACQRVQDFAVVQENRSHNEKMEGIDAMFEAVGIDDDVRSIFKDWVEDFVGPGFDGPIWLGFIVGLYVHQYESED